MSICDPDSAAARPFAYTGDDPLTAIDPTGHLALVDGYNASKAIAGSASNIQHVIADQHKAPRPPKPQPPKQAKANAGRKAAAKPATHKVADAAPQPPRPSAPPGPRDLRRARAVRLDTVLQARRRELRSVG